MLKARRVAREAPSFATRLPRSGPAPRRVFPDQSWPPKYAYSNTLNLLEHGRNGPALLPLIGQPSAGRLLHSESRLFPGKPVQNVASSCMDNIFFIAEAQLLQNADGRPIFREGEADDVGQL